MGILTTSNRLRKLLNRALFAVCLFFLLETVFSATVFGAAIKGLEEGSQVSYCKQIDFVGASITLTNSGMDCTLTDAGGGGGAPTDADYLVGTANGSLSAEIVVGATPGGELGNTWASPTVDATHSGSAHHDSVTVSGTPNYITLSGQDIVRAKLDITDDTNFVAGRSLTLSTNTVDVDAELYTDRCGSLGFESPTTADDFESFSYAATNWTITGIGCETSGTGSSLTFDVNIDDGTPTGINGSAITCNTTWAVDSSLAGDTDFDTGDRLDLNLISIGATTPDYFFIHVIGTKDD